VAVRHGMQDREGEAGEGMIRNGGRRREWEWRLGEWGRNACDSL